MSNSKRDKVTVDKSDEMRTKEISEMIGEGGLGAEKYYEVTKNTPSEGEEAKMVDEGGLGEDGSPEEHKQSIDNFSNTSSDKPKNKSNQ